MRDDYPWGVDGFRPIKIRIRQTICQKTEKTANDASAKFSLPHKFFCHLIWYQFRGLMVTVLWKSRKIGLNSFYAFQQGEVHFETRYVIWWICLKFQHTRICRFGGELAASPLQNCSDLPHDSHHSTVSTKPRNLYQIRKQKNKVVTRIGASIVSFFCGFPTNLWVKSSNFLA